MASSRAASHGGRPPGFPGSRQQKKVDGSAGADKGAAIGLEIVMLVFHWRHLNEQKRQTTSGWSARSFDPDNLNPLRQQGKGLPG